MAAAPEMYPRPVIDVSRLPTLVFGYRTPVWWAAMGFIAIEGTMFSILIASYFYLSLVVPRWPPPGAPIPGLFLPTLNVVLMIASCYPSYLASEAAKKNDSRRLGIMLVINVAIALGTFYIRILDWRAMNVRWDSGTYGSIIWTIFGLHTFDYVCGILGTIVFCVIVFTRPMGEQQRQGIEFDSWTWYFVVAIWIPLYATVYIAPHLIRLP